MKPKFDQKTWKIIWGSLAVILLAGIIFFFTFFKVDHVEVMGSSHYSQAEIRKMILRGPTASNSVLAPIFCTKEEAGDMPFVEGYSVAMINRNTICISVKEKKPVGCIPYLDSFVYFDRNGIFIESSRIRDESIPFFDGINVTHVIKGEKLPIKGKTILNTAVALSTIFRKNQMVPDHIRFDSNNRISLVYGNITVMLGEDKFLEDKMTRVMGILPQIQNQKGILHLESIGDSAKDPTFELEPEKITAENWNGGYNKGGDFTGDGEYDVNGRYIGPKPLSELELALEKWSGGYDGEGDYTGSGEYDANGNYVGAAPTQETLDARGDWKGGFNEDGSFNGTGGYDMDGNYIGPNPALSDESGYGDGYNDNGYNDNGYYSDDYDNSYNSGYNYDYNNYGYDNSYDSSYY